MLGWARPEQSALRRFAWGNADEEELRELSGQKSELKQRESWTSKTRSAAAAARASPTLTKPRSPTTPIAPQQGNGQQETPKSQAATPLSVSNSARSEPPENP